MAAILIGPALDLIHGVLDKIWPDQNTLAKAKADAAMAMLKGQFDTEMASIQAVNTTMQAEAKSEHWPQYSWRPAIGFAFALETGGLGLVFTLLLGRLVFGYALPTDIIPQVTGLVGAFSVLFAAQGAILGAAAAGRSFEKWQSNNTLVNGGKK